MVSRSQRQKSLQLGKDAFNMAGSGRAQARDEADKASTQRQAMQMVEMANKRADALMAQLLAEQVRTEWIEHASHRGSLSTRAIAGIAAL